MIDGLLGKIDSMRILQNSLIPNYINKQTFIPKSKKKRIINKCRKKYTISVSNNFTFWLDNTSIVCSNLMYSTFLNLKIWGK